VQAIVLDEPTPARRAVEHFRLLSERARRPSPEEDERCPRPRSISRDAAPRSRVNADLVALPGGTFDMVVCHDRRECGCYPEGAGDEALWGWFYKDTLTHRLSVTLPRFAMRRTAVTNAEYLAFVHRSGYRPADPDRFLNHLPRGEGGSLPEALAPDLADLPVTFVGLADAWAFADAHGERLPTEGEWQWAAEGAGAGNPYPWGSDERPVGGALKAAHDETTATPQGILGLSGNAWELTDSERTDGHTRFVMLRGGIFLPPGESEWLVARGALKNDSHTKYILLADALDRSASVSFRTVRDLE